MDWSCQATLLRYTRRGMHMTKDKTDKKLTEDQIARRRDDAVRRALNTPPKPHKDMKKGKKRQDERPTASGDEKHT